MMNTYFLELKTLIACHFNLDKLFHFQAALQTNYLDLKSEDWLLFCDICFLVLDLWSSSEDLL